MNLGRLAGLGAGRSAPRASLIRRRILAAVLPAAIVVLCAMGIWNRLTLRVEALGYEEHVVRRDLAKASEELSSVLDRPRADVVTLARSALITRYHFNVVYGLADDAARDAAALRDSFRQFLAVAPSYRAVSYLDAGGGLVWAAGRARVELTDDELRNELRALPESATDLTEPPTAIRGERGAEHLRYWTQVRDGHGVRFGTLALDLDVAALAQVVDNARPDASGISALVGPDRRVLRLSVPPGSSSREVKVLRAELDAIPAFAAGAPGDPISIRRAQDALAAVAWLPAAGAGPSLRFGIAIVVPHTDVFARITTLGRDTLVATLGAVLSLGLVSWVVVIRISRELDRTTCQLEGRMTELARAKRELETTQAQLVQSAKLAALGELVAGVAHEMNNPVGVVYANVTMLLGRLPELEELSRAGFDAAQAQPGAEAAIGGQRGRFEALAREVAKLLRGCRLGAERARAIVDNLRSFARAGEGEVQIVDLNEQIEAALAILRHRIEGRPIEVHRDLHALPPYACRAGHLSQVFVNVVANAIDAVSERGNLWIRSAVVADPKPHLEIEVGDDGPGIPAELLPRVFEPFFTTKPPGRGTGLGLSLSYGIVRDHGGSIEASSRASGGARLVITLPLPAVGDSSPRGRGARVETT